MTHTLTPTEVNAALAWLEPGDKSLAALAEQLDLTADELLAIIARPHVDEFIESVRPFIEARARILACYNHTAALQSLAAVCQDKEADPYLRVRAAATILRGAGPAGAPSVRSAPCYLSPARTDSQGAGRSRRPHPPGGPPQDSSIDNHSTSAPPSTPRALPPPEKPDPHANDIHTDIPAANAEPPPQASGLIASTHCALPLRDTTVGSLLARTRLHLTASAHIPTCQSAAEAPRPAAGHPP